MDEVSKAKVEFIEKASNCEFNHLWKCKHNTQRGKTCTEICVHYHNIKEKEEVETINN